ncbi:MAG: serine/threonine protein kinase [Prochlorotrichaceae cyanobacterium]|jgi:serine/threonine protein kinase
MPFIAGQALKQGKYTIESFLGQGRFAQTWLAKDSGGKRWVIKVLDQDLLNSLSGSERDRLKNLFWNEAIVLARCDGKSPYIVRIDTPFEHDGLPCLPLEYVGGTSLAKRSQQILPESVALAYIHQIADAVNVLHAEKMVHRDIRPDNIFLRDRDGKVEVVLTDFGLALEFDTELSRTRTQERIKGFSALELFSSGQAVGAYTDIYSLAATLYEMLTGEIPVSADDRKIRGTPLITPQQKNPDISGHTSKAILQGMELESRNRPQTIEAWLQELGTAPGSPQVKRPVNWEKWSVIWGAVAVCIGLLTWIGDQILSRQGSTPPAPPTQQNQP